jgi:amino acid adenylation domain-containing protein
MVSDLPLSAAQLGIWYALKAGGASPAYNMAEYIKIAGAVDKTLFETALRQVVSETEALRVRFIEQDGIPRQQIVESPDWAMTYLDLSSEPDPIAAAEAWIHTDITRPVDLCDGPFFTYALFKAAPEKYLWYARNYHLVMDGLGGMLIARRVAHVYSALVAGSPIECSSFGSLAALIEDDAAYRTSSHFQSDRKFWLDELADCPEPPSLGIRTSPVSEQSLKRIADLPRATVDRLEQLGQRMDLTFPQVVTVGMAIFIHRLTEAEDVVLGQMMTARMSRASRNTPAMMTNVVPLRLEIKPDMPVEGLAVQVRRKMRSAMRHQRYRIADIRRDLRRIDRPIIRQIISIKPFENPTLYAGARGPTTSISTGPADDLTVQVGADQSEHGGWRVEFDANPALYDGEYVTCLLHRFLRLLELLDDPAASIGTFDVLPDEERRKILVDWNRTRSDYPRDRQVHDLFAEQARRTPNRVAVAYEQQQLTYRQLNEQADRLARHLVAAGVGPNERVALHVERSLDMVVGLLGILKAGGAYVPLDPNYPRDRLDFILGDCQPLVLLTQQSLRDRLQAGNAAVLCLDALPAQSALRPTAAGAGKAGDLAYVLYTSGSTGQPKGVQIPHRALVNFLSSMQREPGIAPSDTLLSVTSLSFDIAGLELFLPLMTGARVVIASSEVAADGFRLAMLMEKCGATIMQATPATWRLLLEAAWVGNQQLRILCGGEAWPAELASALLPRCGSLWNMYGPTETTVWSAVAKVEQSQSVLIGPPIANTSFYVLDRDRRPVPIGVPGELYIGGDSVSHGYLNRPELTSQRFVADPFSDEPAARMYQTGDRVRYLPNGRLEFLGRLDHQVKIRGFRIELGEIEAVLRQHPEIEDAVVLAREDGTREKRLVAYLTASGAAGVAVGSVRDFLRRKLAPYMMPAAFVPLDAFPLTPNGKIDRNALPAPDDQSRGDTGATHVAPRTQMEELLAGLWRDSLQIGQVGIHDNFFDLGGDSLSMLRLSLAIEQTTGRDCPLPWLFEAPTIAGLAGILDGQTSASSYSPLVLMRPGNDEPPIFLVHPVGGTLTQLIPIAKSIPGSNPIYGIQAKGFEDADTPFDRIDAMAECYVNAITEVQPHGPYFIGGMCFGGLVAIEIANRLMERGEAIGLLVLLDTYPNPKYWPLSFKIEHFVIRRITESLATLRRLGHREAVAFVAEKCKSLFRKVTAQLSGGGAFIKVPDTLPPAVRAVFAGCVTASENYRPSYFPGKVTYLMCGYHTYMTDGPTAVWSRLVGELEVHHAPIMMRPEYVGDWLFDRIQDAVAQQAEPGSLELEAESNNEYEPADLLMRM